MILLIFGGVVFTVSFLLPAGRKEESEKGVQIDEALIRDMVDREIADAKTQISAIIDETITYSMEKTERSMERLTNEKIMAVNEYSDTVLEQINKNHKEAVFLYDMLNDKHENLKNTVSEAVRTATVVKQTVKDAEITAREAKEQAATVKEQVVAVKERAGEVKEQEDSKPVKEFTPIQAERVEIITPPEETEGKQETVKPKKRTARKTKSEQAAKTQNTEKTEIKETVKTEKAARIDLSMTAPAKAGGRNSNERILELHKAGKSNMAIAKELGLGIGEVKLVIDLFEGI